MANSGICWLLFPGVTPSIQQHLTNYNLHSALGQPQECQNMLMETCLSPARMSFSGTSHAVTHLLEQARVSGAVLPPWIYLGSASTVLRLYLNMSTMHMKERHNADHQKTRGKKLKDTSETKRVQEAIGSSC